MRERCRRTRFRSWLSPGPILLALILLGSIAPFAGAQPIFDPNYHLTFGPDLEGAVGATIDVDCRLSMQPVAAPLAGWTFGICHDATQLAPQSIAPGAILMTINNGQPAEFIDLQTDAALGATMGVVICFAGCATLVAPVTELPILTVGYEVIGTPGEVTELTYCSTVAIGGNPVPLLLVTAAAGQRVPLVDPGPVTIIELSFRRGDADGDGATTIGDAISLLGVLFGPADPLPCDDASDANDDGTINIADAIRILQYLFAGALPPPAPFPDCGPDPTPDALDCETPPTTC